MSGSGGVTGQASLVSQPGVNEMLQSAQRQQAVADLKQERQAEIKRDEYLSTVVKNHEAESKKLRDDDPRQERRHPQPQDEDGARQQEDPQPHIDIRI